MARHTAKLPFFAVCLSTWHTAKVAVFAVCLGPRTGHTAKAALHSANTLLSVTHGKQLTANNGR